MLWSSTRITFHSLLSVPHPGCHFSTTVIQNNCSVNSLMGNRKPAQTWIAPPCHKLPVILLLLLLFIIIIIAPQVHPHPAVCGAGPTGARLHHAHALPPGARTSICIADAVVVVVQMRWMNVGSADAVDELAYSNSAARRMRAARRGMATTAARRDSALAPHIQSRCERQTCSLNFSATADVHPGCYSVATTAFWRYSVGAY